MAFSDLKVKDEDFNGKNIQSLEKNTVIGMANELKRLFDAPAQEVLKEKLNALIDYFLSTGAAEEMKTPKISEDSGDTVAKQLEYLMRELQSVYAGSIVNGSVTDIKLSNEKGQIKQEVAKIKDIIRPLDLAPDGSIAMWVSRLLVEDEYDENGTEIREFGYIENDPGALFSPDGFANPRFGLLPVSCGGTGANNSVSAKTNLGIYKKLWAGSWAAGSISVPGWKNYNLFSVVIDGAASPILVIRLGSYLRGIGGNITETGVWTMTASFTINDDDTWKYGFAGYLGHTGGSGHNALVNNSTVTGIWGIL